MTTTRPWGYSHEPGAEKGSLRGSLSLRRLSANLHPLQMQSLRALQGAAD
jgi:hypothetical protein